MPAPGAARPLGLEVLVRPGGSRNQVAGCHDGALVIKLTAPPVGGRANDALRKLIAKRLDVPRSRVAIARGARSQRKLVVVEGLAPAAVRRALEGAGPAGR
jgi:uncharacterized protein YggU (UPF0235/DUF167 family)